MAVLEDWVTGSAPTSSSAFLSTCLSAAPHKQGCQLPAPPSSAEAPAAIEAGWKGNSPVLRSLKEGMLWTKMQLRGEGIYQTSSGQLRNQLHPHQKASEMGIFGSYTECIMKWKFLRKELKMPYIKKKKKNFFSLNLLSVTRWDKILFTAVFSILCD